MRWRMLRTVSAGPAMVLPGIVGRSTDAPMTPHGMPSSSMVSEMMPVGSPSAISRSTTPCGARGTAISLMFSAAMRPVNRFVSATVTGAPPDHAGFAVSRHFTLAPRGEKARRRAAKSPAETSNSLGLCERFCPRGWNAWAVRGSNTTDERRCRAMPSYGSRRRAALPEGHCGRALAPPGAARYRCRLSGRAVCIPTEFGPHPLIVVDACPTANRTSFAEGRQSKGQSP